MKGTYASESCPRTRPITSAIANKYKCKYPRNLMTGVCKGPLNPIGHLRLSVTN